MHPLVGLHLSGNTLTALDDVGNAGHLGRPAWNVRQLLKDLALRLGLPHPEVSRGFRVQEWSKRLAARLADATRAAPYYAAAYAVDPTGTAAQLLRLRDELVDAGWNGERLTGAERLETLAELAALDGPPLPPAGPDRLVAVEAELDRATRTPYGAIELVDDVSLWPGRWRRVFQRLRALGMRIETHRDSTRAPTVDGDLARFQRALRGEPASHRPISADGSLVVLRAATSSALAEPVAALLAADARPSTVIIRGLDPGPLDAALAWHGLSRQGVSGRSRWRPALQVLRLAFAVAFLPRDPRRVLELLTLPSGPFAGRAGRRLAEALCERAGIGNAVWVAHKQELSEAERAGVDAWIESPRLDPAGAPRAAVLEVAERVLEWIAGRGGSLEDPSWQDAALHARTFADAVHGDGRERLDRASLEQLLQDLTEESSTCMLAAEESGRLDHVDSPERLLVCRERVVWWGFVGEPPPPRPVLRSAELALLRRAGIHVPDSAAQLRARLEGFVRAVCSAQRQLVLVIPEQVAGERCQPHPLLDELVARVLGSELALDALAITPDELAKGAKLAAHLAPVPTEAAPVVPLPAARRQWRLDPGLIRPRDAESASSLEKLIGCPLSWTLHYQAGLRSRNRGGLPSGALLAGKLGHRLLEELHLKERLAGDLEQVRTAAELELDQLLEQEGARLLTPGASDERHQLRSELVEAIVSLVGLLRDGELDIAGVEVPVEAELGRRPLRGSIDLLLKNRRGEERVLDLKYGSTTYADKLKAGHAIQLAIYAEARRQQSGVAELPPAAYFSLKGHRLIATDAASHFNRHAHPGPPLSRTGAQIQNTLDSIATSLERGRIPVAGVKDMAEAGFLKTLGVASERSGDHLALEPESTCHYCEFGAVCGRSWEQPW